MKHKTIETPKEVIKKPPFNFGRKGGLTLDVESDEEVNVQPEPSVEHSDDQSSPEKSNKFEQLDSIHSPTHSVGSKRDDGIQIEGMEATGDISYKWVESLKNIQIVEKGIPFKEFYTNYALRAITQEFKLIRKLTETKIHIDQIVKREKGKDRYRDLGPFKHTQVKLKVDNKNFDPNVDRYMNANLIRSAKLRPLFIATQGPLDNTIQNFWKMIWQEKVSLIVMLCPLQEGDKIKCTQYWPTTSSENQQMKVSDELTVTYVRKIQAASDLIDK